MIDRLRVEPGRKVSLAKHFATEVDHGLEKEQLEAALRDSVERLAELQDKLYAQNTYSVLLVFQAMDAAGKDGTIKHVTAGLNPQGCQVFSFKAPSAEELDHDYLWRAARALPERGRIGIFNRSYYEEVLVVRVHPAFLDRQQLPPKAKGKKVWERRFQQMVNFERHLVENGTLVLKFFLNVSRGEQKKRFLERIEEPEKNWKFSAQDVREREHWDAYMAAYEDCFRHTSSKWAPWYVIPADDKAYMRVAVADIIAGALEGLELQYPRLTPEEQAALETAKAQLLAEEK